MLQLHSAFLPKQPALLGNSCCFPAIVVPTPVLWEREWHQAARQAKENSQISIFSVNSIRFLSNFISFYWVRFLFNLFKLNDFDLKLDKVSIFSVNWIRRGASGSRQPT